MNSPNQRCDLGQAFGQDALKVLIIDSDPYHRRLLSAFVHQLGDETILVADGPEALKEARRLQPELLITCLRTATLPAIDIVSSLRQDSRDQPYILVSGYADQEAMVAQLLKAGADDWLVKPVRHDAAMHRLRIGRRVARLQRANGRLSAGAQRQAEESSLLHDQVRILAFTDPLTGLPNRNAAKQSLQSLWHRSVDTKSPLTCLLADLDHFKKLNHSLGRAQGDAVLRTVATSLAEAITAQNVVTRLGGDRFLVICPDKDLDHALAQSESMLSVIAGLGIRVDGVPLTMSIGVAERRSDINTPIELLCLAERGMHRAKFNGRNRAVSGHNAD